MAEEVTESSSKALINNLTEHSVNQLETNVSSTSIDTSVPMDISTEIQQFNVVDDEALQTVISSMSEPEMNAFLDQLNKHGKAYLPSIGQTVEVLAMRTNSDNSSTMNITLGAHTTSDSILQELKSFIQQPPADIVPRTVEQKTNTTINQSKSNIQTTLPISRQTRTANTYGGTSVLGGTTSRPGTAVKSTVTQQGGIIARKPNQQQSIQDDRVFFGRTATSSTIGQGQYHHRTGLISNNRQNSIPISTSSFGQQRRIAVPNPMENYQRRTLSWFQNRPRRNSSGDEIDSDVDSSPPSYSVGSNDNSGPRRRSNRVPKPKHHADFVTFPLLDRDEHGNPITTTPYSIPSHKAEDDEDDIPYRLMDSQRPTQVNQPSTIGLSSSNSQLNSVSMNSGRKARTVAELRANSLSTKKQARWPDDELYHVKSLVPLIMPQQITNPSTMRNKGTMCKPIVNEREVEAKPTRFTVATQTEMENMIPDVPLLSLPVPIYLPSPTPSYRLFKPRAVPIPVPFYVPIMIPVLRKTHRNIQDYLQKQRDLLPDDPFQAALILHAESLVRAENHPQQTVQNSNQESIIDITRDDIYLLTTQTVQNLPELDVEAHYIDPITSNDPEVQKLLQMLPDAGYRLKWTYGVQAFQQWCEQRTKSRSSNSLEETTISRNDPIRSDLLSYNNPDELQQVLEEFIREVRRPNGEIYLPESIFYLCLGIQFYLNINNRQIDLFDPRYFEFNATLNKILLNYSARVLPESNVHVSLIDEELLYETQQFGTSNPYSLLNTLIFTNSKYFNLKTVDAHLMISFANFGKYSQWVRLPSGSPQGQQMNYLRFYAHNPDLKLLADSPTVYEITEHMTDPLRCPIKHFDFYLSKCPEKIRGTADIFYLNPIVAQTNDNAIWFSSNALPSTVIEHILNRLKLIPSFYMETKPVDIGATSSLISNSASGTNN